MSDFLAREANILGDEFSTSLHGNTSGDDIDFDRAASAFPDIDIDSGDFIQPSQPPVVASRINNGFSFDDFETPAFQPKDTQVKVTGDDDLDKFETEFPEIDAGPVSRHFIHFRAWGCTPRRCDFCYTGLSNDKFPLCTMIVQARDDNFTDMSLSATFSTAATQLRKYIRSSTTPFCIFFDPHLDPKYFRGWAPGNEVRMTTA